MFANIYQGRRVLLTGYTGFKGSWLALWLTQMGAEVTGLALAPEIPSAHWNLLKLDIAEHRQDIRDAAAVAKIIQDTKPDIVFHLAAQPLVRRSYRDPLETWSTNVMGTANVLEGCRLTPSVQAIVVVTSDKCYKNQEWVWGYREGETLGGHDPYSASKAAEELVAESYRQSFFAKQGVLLATARAGNVIGGGDWSEDRLIPDVARSVAAKAPLEIRSPQATRPWQHVLDSLQGYLLLGKKLLERKAEFAEAWNFGPAAESNQSVEKVLTNLQSVWGAVQWHVTETPQPHEANLLYLDSTKAQRLLGWQPHWNFAQTLAATAHWYQTYQEQGKILSREQLQTYMRTKP
jgi:CDP-glucose 4,6-dehydratase